MNTGEVCFERESIKQTTAYTQNFTLTEINVVFLLKYFTCIQKNLQCFEYFPSFSKKKSGFFSESAFAAIIKFLRIKPEQELFR